MKTIIKHTIIDLKKNRAVLYMLFFGAFLFTLAFAVQIKFVYSSGNTNTDLSYFGKLIFLHGVVFIYFIFLTAITTSDLEEEIREGFHEITLLYMSRIRVFFAKFIAYCLFFFLLLELTVFIGLIIAKWLLQVAMEWQILIAISGLIFNICFLISLIIIFTLFFHTKNSGFSAFLLCIFVSLMNAEIVMNWILPQSWAKAIASCSPAFLHLQNEFLRLGIGMGFSKNFSIHFLNVCFYVGLFLLLLYYEIRKFECES